MTPSWVTSTVMEARVELEGKETVPGDEVPTSVPEDLMDKVAAAGLRATVTVSDVAALAAVAV